MIYEKEITVSINMKIDDLKKYLINNNFKKIDNYIVDDLYYIESNIDLSMNILELLKKCVIVRSIDDTKHYLMYKYKEYDSNENIIRQGKSKVQVYNRNDLIELLGQIGYKKLINVIDKIDVYEKDGLILNVEFVNDKYLYIEIEENDKYKTIEQMINALKETGIKYDSTDYFVKKAKVIFNDEYNK